MSLFMFLLIYCIINNGLSVNIPLYRERVCKFDIKLPGMSPDYIEKAKMCTVIEGKIIISHLSNNLCKMLTFPLLREVTDYVLLAFTSCGDTSLKIFPNLMVIRGYELVQGYSLVVYNNAWKHLNFANLRINLGGNILVALNPYLCNVGNIDWNYLNDNFYQDNKDSDNFKKVYLKTNRFICPNTCSSACPESIINGQKTRLCWSYNICQSICSRFCTSKKLYCHVTNPSICCHSQCLGGCNGESDFHCVTCRNFRFNDQCVMECPPGYFGFKERRCVLGTDCTSKNMFIILNQRKCVKECPFGLFPSISNKTKYCVNMSTSVGKEMKDCGLLFLTSFKDLDQVENCYSAEKVIISLQVGGREISKKLKAVFKNLKIIKQFIQIMRSNYLESLSFLEPLLEIQGHSFIGTSNVILDVTGNNALSKLWNPNPKLKVTGGSVKFLANKNLCKTFIHIFIKKIGLQSSLYDQELIDSTNGHIAICIFIHLKLNVTEIKSRSIKLTWRNKPSSTSYQILSGLMYYRSISNNMAGGGIPDSSCSSAVWSVIEAECISNETGFKLSSASLWPQDDGKEYTCLISSLKPATNYQIYIEFRFTRSDSAAISNRVYVVTSTEMPTPPQQLEAVSLTPHDIRLSWKPPLHPNGLITKYIIYYAQVDNSFETEYMNENYCESNLNSGFRSLAPLRENPRELPDDSLQQSSCINCTTCKKICDKSPQKQEELLEMTKFDNHIHSMIFIQRKSRNLSPHFSVTQRPPVMTINHTTSPVNMTQSTPGYPKTKQNPIISNITSLNMIQVQIPISEKRHQYYFTLTNLNYFTEYKLEMIACHSPLHMGNYSQDVLMRLAITACSNKISASARTMAIPDADVIPTSPDGKVLQTKSLSNGIELSWNVPNKVNGLILFYRLRYVIDSNEKWTYRCIDSKPVWIIKRDSLNKSTYMKSKIDYFIRLHISGTYKFQIMVVSLAGNGSWSNNVNVVYKATDNSYLDNILKISLGTIITFLMVLVFTISVSVVFWKKKRQFILTTNNDYYFSGQDEWNIDFQDVKLLIPIGKGNFGIVYSGLIKKLNTPAKCTFQNATFPMKVAIKTVSQAATIEEIAQFLSEAFLMKQFLGYHIVHLIGIYSGNIQKDNALYPMVVMELMENGDLSKYLHRFAECSDKGFVDGPQCLLWAIQIADGMCYLNCKRFVHRDLAARNCLVDSNLNIKIGDFGLARSTNENYYYRVRGRAKMPVRWMAPESLKSAVFTTKTDVWSYGVILYEISTLGGLPYSGMNHDSVIEYVRDGGRLDLDDLKMPSALLDVMIWCWSYSDSDRPSFMQILEYLVPYANIEFFQKVSFYHNGCYEFDQCENCSKTDCLEENPNSIQLSVTHKCKHVYKCTCSDSLPMCERCSGQSKTTAETDDILTFSVSDILKQHNQ